MIRDFQAELANWVQSLVLFLFYSFLCYLEKIVDGQCTLKIEMHAFPVFIYDCVAQDILSQFRDILHKFILVFS